MKNYAKRFFDLIRLMIIPDEVRVGEFTEILLSNNKEKELLLVTIEYCYNTVSGNKAYITCVRTKADICLVTGVLRKIKMQLDL